MSTAYPPAIGTPAAGTNIAVYSDPSLESCVCESLRRSADFVTRSDDDRAASVCILDASTSPVAQKLRSFSSRFSRAGCVVLAASASTWRECVALVADERADRVFRIDSPVSTWEQELRNVFSNLGRLAAIRSVDRSRLPAHVLLTGGTGFLGRALLRELLVGTDTKVSVVVRDLPSAPALKRLSAFLERYGDRVRIVPGDIRHRGLGIEPEILESLRDDVSAIWHLAASTRFELALRDKTFAINVGGTRNVVDAARSFPALRCLHHVSTAYVAGSEAGRTRVLERHDSRPPHFHNVYEKSKYDAEQVVVQSGVPHVIYRPSILIGDSIAGRNDGQSVYNVAKLVRLAKRVADRDCERHGLPSGTHSFRVVANADAHKNMLPSDFAAAMMVSAAASSAPDGAIFHIVHDQPVRIGEMIDAIADILDVRDYEIVRMFGERALSLPERTMESVAKTFRPYMTDSDPTFDTSRVHEALGAYELPPVDRSYLHWTLSTFFAHQQPGMPVRC